MEATERKNLNLDDVNSMVENFISTNEAIIKKHWSKKNESSKLGYDAFIEDLRPKLINSCITFINSNLDLSILNAYLFPTVLVTSREQQQEGYKKITVPICPACKFLGIDSVLNNNKIYRCFACDEKLKQPISLQLFKLLKMYAVHNKVGYKCPSCNRFIPHPLDSSRDITCPFLDCTYMGNIGQLIKMRHPTITQKVFESSLDCSIPNSNLTGKDLLESKEVLSDSKLEIKELIINNYNLIKDIIESQMNSLDYTASNYTKIHYMSMYESFIFFLETQPEKMISYLIYLNRGEGLQHKIFQEYIRILEKKLPFGFKKNNKNFKITSLLDENLCLFDGISNFVGIINDKRQLKNNTQEFYIGGRAGSYSKPFYIGKLLEVINKSSGQSILSDVQEYSFSKICFTDTPPGTEVSVAHLRIPPHYQMGGMVYLNRIRRKVVDKIYLTIHGSKRQIKI